MPLVLFYQPSFNRSLKSLGFDEKQTVGIILEALLVYYSSGCKLETTQKIHPGFFYKQLRKPYYETGIPDCKYLFIIQNI